MFDDRKAKAGPSGFPGPAFVDPVKALEDPLLILLRDADAAVLHGEEGAAVFLSGPDQDGSVFAVVLDGVLDQVFDGLSPTFSQKPISTASDSAAARSFVRVMKIWFVGDGKAKM